MFSSSIKKISSLFVYCLIALSTLFFVFCSQIDNTENVLSSDASIKLEAGRLVLYGDTRGSGVNHDKVANDIANENAIAVFNTGDIVDKGSTEEFQVFYAFSNVFIEQPQMNFFPVVGNHDVWWGNYSVWEEMVEAPNNKKWYSVDIGNIHFVVIDSMDLRTSGEKGEQWQWVIKDLENVNHDVIDIIIAIYHIPSYSSGTHGNDELGQNHFMIPAWKKYGVDVTVSGHDHIYERTVCKTYGINYIVSGGGGAPLYNSDCANQKDPDVTCLTTLKGYHYIVCDPVDSSSDWFCTAKDTSAGTVIETFTISNFNPGENPEKNN